MKLKFALLTLTLAAARAFASDAAHAQATQVVPLQSGETLYVFKDGVVTT